MSDCSVEIDRDDLIALKNLYLSDGSKSYIGYTTLDNYIRWFQQDPSVKHIKVFCLNGDFSDGTFVITDRCSAYADTFNENHQNLLRLLKLIDYSKGYDFLSVRPALRPIVTEAVTSIGVDIVIDEPTLLYYLPKKEALKFEVQPPDGIHLHSITKDSEMEKVNSNWPERNENSFLFLKRMAMYNSSVGVFKEDGTLASWIFRLPTGLLGVLQTDKNFYGKGYGTLAVKAASRKIAETSQDIYVDIFANNEASRNLFEKLGFKSIGEVYWIATKITWTPDDE